MDQPHILVVDDDDRLRSLLKTFLVSKGYHVTKAPDAETAHHLLTLLCFDLLIVDVMMPGQDGLSFTQTIRKQDKNTPILLLTARAAPKERIEGLKTGADDFLAKPFEPEELALRIRAILRRTERPGSFSPSQHVKFGPCSFDLSSGELVCKGQHIHLTGAEQDLLTLLAQKEGQVISRSHLAEGAGGERSVDVQVTRLRRKIEDNPRFPRWLKTVRGSGYKLDCQREGP